MNLYHHLVWAALSVTPLLLSTWAFIIYWSEFLLSKLEADPASASWDYVIVGGGSAGSVLAARLSEDPEVSVLLLEAGGDPGWLSSIPVITPSLQLTGLDWQHLTSPQVCQQIIVFSRFSFKFNQTISGSCLRGHGG